MTTDMTAPATKLDVQMLMEEMGKIHTAIERRQNELSQWKDDLRLHFDAAVDHFKDAVRVINTEKLYDHEHRIIHLEVINGVRK
jgi:hypothetical protein